MNGKPEISSTCDAVVKAVLAAMPGWRFLTIPEAFTWAPDRHLRARLVSGSRQQDVVIRRSWREESHQI